MYGEEDLEKVYHAIEAATSTCRTVCEDVALMPNLAIVKMSELHRYTAVKLEIIDLSRLSRLFLSKFTERLTKSSFKPCRPSDAFPGCQWHFSMRDVRRTVLILRLIHVLFGAPHPSLGHAKS